MLTAKDILQAALTLALLTVVGLSVMQGALRNQYLALTLITIALILPSPVGFALKVKDWIQVVRGKGNNNCGGSSSVEAGKGDMKR
jgi:hypothetical protein